MSGTGEAGKRGPEVRSDCWIRMGIRDSGGVRVELKSKVAGMFGDRIISLLEQGCRVLGSCSPVGRYSLLLVAGPEAHGQNPLACHTTTIHNQ